MAIIPSRVRGIGTLSQKSTPAEAALDLLCRYLEESP